MYNVKDTIAAWSLHWFQIVSNLAHCQQDQQDRTRASWNSQHSSKLPNDWNSPNPRDPHSLPSAAHHIWFHLWNLPGPHRPDTKLVGWGSVGRLGWSQFEFIPCRSARPIPQEPFGELGRSRMSGSPASASPAIHNDDNACHEICVKTHEAKGWEEQDCVIAHSPAQTNVMEPNFVSCHNMP